jgi:hypothetical protein
VIIALGRLHTCARAGSYFHSDLIKLISSRPEGYFECVLSSTTPKGIYPFRHTEKILNHQLLHKGFKSGPRFDRTENRTICTSEHATADMVQKGI